MDQAAVQAAIPVRQRVDVDEAEGDDGGLQDRIDLFGIRQPQPVVAGVQRRHEVGNILGPRADELGQGVVAVVPFAQKDPVVAIADRGQAIIADQDAVQAVDLGLIEGALAGLEHRASPALQAVDGRALAFDLETRAAVGQQHEACRTRHDMAARLADGLLGPPGQIERDQRFELLGAPDHRAEGAGAKQVVPDAVALRETLLAGEIEGGVQSRDRRDGRRILEIEPPSCQGLEKEPQPPGEGASWCGADNRFDVLL